MAFLLLAGGVVDSAQAQRGGRGDGGGAGRGGWADPSVIIAAELGYGRVAAEKGRWPALSRIVAEDALLFRPGPVLAQGWLKGQREAVPPIRWRTAAVFMACDGSHAVTTGRWTGAGSSGADAGGGWFANIWRRDKKGYRLILSDDDGSAAENSSPVPAVSASGGTGDDERELEAITARVAACPRRAGRPGADGPGAGGKEAALADARSSPPPRDPRAPLPPSREEGSPDGTLRWRWATMPGGERTLEAWMASDGGEVKILSHRTGRAG
jgi:hypothetical protein